MSSEWLMDDDQFVAAICFAIQTGLEDVDNPKDAYVTWSNELDNTLISDKYIREICLMLASHLKFLIREGMSIDNFDITTLDKYKKGAPLDIPETEYVLHIVSYTENLSSKLGMYLIRNPKQ